MKIEISYVDGRAGNRELMGTFVTPTQLAELSYKYDIMIREKDGKIIAWLDKKGCRFRQM